MSPDPGRPAEVPRLSVTVPTRRRAEHIAACVDSVLASAGPSFELIVVDQSDDRASEEALGHRLRDPRLRYLPSKTRGVCAARNVGIAASRGPILVCTDDDCRVAPDWLASIDRAFENDPAADLIAGRVEVPAELQALGWAVSFPAPTSRTTFESLGKFGWGLTANMALRRSLVAAVGPFDTALGSGGPLRSGGEPDLVYRALRAGRTVLNYPEAVVAHLGIRRGAAIRPLQSRYHFGTGAAFWKHVRLGDRPALTIFRSLSRSLFSGVLGGLQRRARPDGARKLVSLWSGAADSYRFSIDPSTRLYRLPQ